MTLNSLIYVLSWLVFNLKIRVVEVQRLSVKVLSFGIIFVTY